MTFIIFVICFFINPAQATISDGMNATDLLGQFDDANGTVLNYTTNAINDGAGGVNARGFNGPEGVTMDTVNHRLFVSDSLNNRVLVYNLDANNNLVDRIPDNVLGQVNFTNNFIDLSQSGLHSPYGLAYDAANNRLFVADLDNSRVLVFDVTTITNGENAINVLGQPDFTTESNATTQSKMTSPRGVELDTANNRLFVADHGSRRVLVFDITAITNGENAVNVLGQPNFTSNAGALTQSGLWGAYDVSYDAANQRLFVVDASNRVLVFDVTAITNGENAVNVLGQANFTSDGAATTQSEVNGAYAVSYDSNSKRLFVSDSLNHRVLVFDVVAISNGENAANVLGQVNFTNNTSSTSQSRMNGPGFSHYDQTNNRYYQDLRT